MMRTGLILQSVLAGLLVVPAMTGSSQDGGIRQALADTVAALERVTLTQASVEEGDPWAIEELIELTEPPIPDARARDERLVRLRREVGRLQMTVDELQKPGERLVPPTQVPVPGTKPFSTKPSGTNQGSAIYGLDEATRQQLAQRTTPLDHLSESVQPRGRAGSSLRTFESETFSADILTQGRLFFRAGRYAEAVTLLEGLRDNTEAWYWIARSLEKLGRTEGAIENYRKVVGLKDGGALARRAQVDLDFLEWKRELAQNRKTERKP